ncbi:MAG TPA: L,D-transpeptidase family protein [Gammaproteobacteria bacterium]|nr:L,D-transpeptidase family protein [Gammaproteobacteria bacterium]
MSARVLFGLLFGLALLRVGAPVAAEQSVPSRHEQADKLLVVKSERKLHLLKAGRVLRTFDISLGLVPVGPKQREGDFRTPEGIYQLEARNSDSDYFLSIKISYPNADDRARARTQGVDPGSQIMIHGLPNEPRYDVRRYQGLDWTDGCIAVSNSDMVDIWLMTREPTLIEIRP